MLRGGRSSRTLRQGLLAALGVPLLVILAISVWSDYRNAVDLANDSNDHGLGTAAMLVAEHQERPGEKQEIELELPAINLILGGVPVHDKTRFSLVTAAGLRLAGDSAIAELEIPVPPSGIAIRIVG